jgi:hypothetical protein
VFESFLPTDAEKAFGSSAYLGVVVRGVNTPSPAARVYGGHRRPPHGAQVGRVYREPRKHDLKCRELEEYEQVVPWGDWRSRASVSKKVAPHAVDGDGMSSPDNGVVWCTDSAAETRLLAFTMNHTAADIKRYLAEMKFQGGSMFPVGGGGEFEGFRSNYHMQCSRDSLVATCIKYRAAHPAWGKLLEAVDIEYSLSTSFDGDSLLKLACCTFQPDTCARLLATGASPHVVDAYGLDLVFSMWEHHLDSDEKESPNHNAYRICQMLFRRGYMHDYHNPVAERRLGYLARIPFAVEAHDAVFRRAVDMALYPHIYESGVRDIVYDYFNVLSR